MRPDAKAEFVISLVLWVVAFLVGIFGIFLKFLPAIETGRYALQIDPGTIFFMASWVVLAVLALRQLLKPPQR